MARQHSLLCRQVAMCSSADSRRPVGAPIARIRAAAYLLMLVSLWTAIGCRIDPFSDPAPKDLISSRQLSMRGISAMERGDWETAEQLLGEAVSGCPADPDARLHYARTLWHRGQVDQALAHLQAALELVPDDTELLLVAAEMYLALGQPEPALPLVERALDLSNRSPQAWRLRGRAYEARQEYERALADMQRSLMYEPDDQQTLRTIANLYRQLGRTEQALVNLQYLRDLAPSGEESAQVLYELGMTYADLDRAHEAAENFELAAHRGGPHPELLYRLAAARWASGDARQAQAAAQQALLLEPRHAASRQLLQHIELATRPGATQRH